MVFSQCTTIGIFTFVACLPDAIKSKFVFLKHVCALVAVLAFDFVTSCWNNLLFKVFQWISIGLFCFCFCSSLTDYVGKGKAEK